MITKTYAKLKEAVDSMAPDIDKVDNGQKAAGKRARKTLQEVKVLAQELRVEIMDEVRS